jgi:membrane-bound inhibitor of C-type lysozyme
MTNKQRDLLSILLVAIAVGTLIFHIFLHQDHATHAQAQTTSHESTTVVFNCSENKSLTVTFASHGHAHVHITTNDGRKMSLDYSETTEGARYASSTTVFWNKKPSASMIEGDKVTYANCIPTEESHTSH